MTALELALDEQRRVCRDDNSCYERGYLDGLERAADIVAIKHRALMTGAEPSASAC